MICLSHFKFIKRPAPPLVFLDLVNSILLFTKMLKET